MTIQEQAREVLEGLLKVIVGASQIAIDRGADSGVIDFKELIDSALSQIHTLYMQEFEGVLPKERNGIHWASRFLEKGIKTVEAYQNGFNQCLAEIKDRMKEVNDGD